MDQQWICGVWVVSWVFLHFETKKIEIFLTLKFLGEMFLRYPLFPAKAGENGEIHAIELISELVKIPEQMLETSDLSLPIKVF